MRSRTTSRSSGGRSAVMSSGRSRPGYVLSVAPEQVDAMRLERLLDDDDRRRGTVPSGCEASSLGSAGGRSKTSPSSRSRSSAVPRLLELELTAREELAGLEIELGRHGDVVLALEALVAASIRTASTCARC